MAGGQTREQIRGQMFGDALMHGWMLEGELGMAIPLGLSGLGSGIANVIGATTLRQLGLGAAETFGGAYTLTESGAALTGHEIPGSVSIPANGFVTGMDLMQRDWVGVLADVEGWLHRWMDKNALRKCGE